MDVGIIGVARSGKTTVFNAITRGHAETGTYGAGVEPNIGTVKVPDDRLDRLATLFNPKKITHADLRYLDFPGGLSFGGSGEGPSARFLNALARCDALVHVVRAFHNEAVAHPEGSINPDRDIAAVNLELAYADAAFVERRLERMDIEVRSMKAAERETGDRQMALLRRLKSGLEEGTPLRELQISEDEQHLLEGYQFLTDKPLVLVLNIDEADVPRAGEIEAETRARWQKPGLEVAALSGEIEMELSELSDEDAVEFRKDLGITESGLDRMIRLTYGALGLISFFTVGPDECRAWTVPKGTAAQRAAGKIHSDLERGFIRAEVVHWDQLLEDGSLAESRKHAHLRTEGKGYVLTDGDVMHVLFNV